MSTPSGAGFSLRAQAEARATALDSLRQHKFRSALTLLGIAWGIVSVTVLIAYGDGFATVMDNAFNAFGRDAVVLWPGQTSQQAGGERAGRAIRFEVKDVERIRDECPLVKRVSPELVRSAVIATGVRSTSTAIRGVWPSYGIIRNEVPVAGRFLNDDDVRERRRVVFLGDKVRRRLFGVADPTGEIVTLNGVRFHVIGYMDKLIQFGNYFRPDTESVFIPLSAMGDLFNNKYLSTIVYEPVAPGIAGRSIAQVRAALARHHRFSPTDQRAIRDMSREQFRPIIDTIVVGLQTLLLFVGALTLGIGGVGVMNIMLVSVTERTREIGIRMAVGASRKRILAQFLLEALALTALGGLAGIVVSYGMVFALGQLPLLGDLFDDTSGRGDVVMRLSANTVLLSVLLLGLVGLVSGFIPAVRASRLNPVEALRYE